MLNLPFERADHLVVRAAHEATDGDWTVQFLGDGMYALVALHPERGEVTLPDCWADAYLLMWYGLENAQHCRDTIRLAEDMELLDAEEVDGW